MKNTRKILAVIILSVLTLALAITCSAADADDVTLSVTTVECGVGDTVDVRVIVTGNVGFSSLELSVLYEEAELELVGWRSGFNTPVFTADTDTAGTAVFEWASEQNNTDNGTILTLTLRVLEGARINKTSRISLNVRDATNASGIHVGTDLRAGGVIARETDGAAEPYGTSLSLGSDLTVNLWLLSASVRDENAYARVTKRHDVGCAKEDETVFITRDRWITREGTDELIGIPAEGIIATEMICDVEIEIFVGDPASHESSRSVSDKIHVGVERYALAALRMQEYSDRHTLLVDMLNYGAAAQISFGHNTGRPANAELTDAERALATESVGDLSDTEMTFSGCYYGTSLTLDGGIRVNLYFNDIDPDDIASLCADISFENYLGEAVGYTMSQDDINIIEKDGKYVALVTVTNLTPADFDSLISCKLYGKDKTVPVGSATDSVELYIRDSRHQSPNEEVLNLYTKIIKYGRSVKAAFAVDP